MLKCERSSSSLYVDVCSLYNNPLSLFIYFFIFSIVNFTTKVPHKGTISQIAHNEAFIYDFSGGFVDIFSNT